LGAGLSALLIYSLTSELFSKNSPTVLYSDACERIQASPKIAKYLNGPLTFHNNPPSAVRPRHRNRHITSQVMVDSYGHEHMIMTFYVQGKPEGFAPASDDGYFDSILGWAQEKYSILSDASLNDAIDWSKGRSTAIWEQGKRAFKYLSGTPIPPPEMPALSLEESKDVKKEESGRWGFAGMFTSLKGGRSGSTEKVSRLDGKTFTEGEVHADLVRNNEGYFVFRYLLVDIPSSRERNAIRIFVERGPGVRENEPVMRWNAY
ncbi:TIM21-domain-containing protein, partial [Cyathus striatus]